MSTAMALDEHDNDWHEDAVSALLGLALTQHTVTAEDLLREMRTPPHPNCVGTAFRAAHQHEFIVPTGFRPSNSRSRRGGVIRTWTLNTNNERKTA